MAKKKNYTQPTLNPHNTATPGQVRSFSALWKRITQGRCPLAYARHFAGFVAGSTRRKVLLKLLLVRSLPLTFQTERDRASHLERELVLFENFPEVVRALLPEAQPEPKAEHSPVTTPLPVEHAQQAAQAVDTGESVDWDARFAQEPSAEALSFMEQHSDWQNATFLDLSKFVEGRPACTLN